MLKARSQRRASASFAKAATSCVFVFAVPASIILHKHYKLCRSVSGSLGGAVSPDNTGETSRGAASRELAGELA